MIWRLGATAGALLPVAAQAVIADRGATVAASVPTVWYPFGYPVEAGSLIAALCACAAVRFYVVQKDHPKPRLSLDAPISLLVMMFTFAAVVKFRPDPAMALVYGTTFGVVGAGLISIVKKNADRVLGAFGLTGGTDTDKSEG